MARISPRVSYGYGVVISYPHPRFNTTERTMLSEKLYPDMSTILRARVPRCPAALMFSAPADQNVAPTKCVSARSCDCLNSIQSAYSVDGMLFP